MRYISSDFSLCGNHGKCVDTTTEQLIINKDDLYNALQRLQSRTAF